MRKVIDLQMEFWGKDIVDIEFDLQSRDEIPKLMIGLQYIYSTAAIRDEVFNVLNWSLRYGCYIKYPEL